MLKGIFNVVFLKISGVIALYLLDPHWLLSVLITRIVESGRNFFRIRLQLFKILRFKLQLIHSFIHSFYSIIKQFNTKIINIKTIKKRKNKEEQKTLGHLKKRL